MATKFFSIELYSDMTGEIVSITTSTQISKKVSTFDQIQDFCTELANAHHCKGAVRNEYGMKVVDFNYSEYCENNICFSWQSDEWLQDFIDKHTPEKKEELTPLQKQYRELKEKYPDAMMLFHSGDFYETVEEDAIEAAKLLGITLTYANVKGRVKGHELAGFPRHALDAYLPKLVRAGKRIAIVDEVRPVETKKIAINA